MSATLLSNTGTTVTIQLQVELTDSMLNSEENILSSLNEAGSIATEEALKYFDTDGSKLGIIVKLGLDSNRPDLTY